MSPETQAIIRVLVAAGMQKAAEHVYDLAERAEPTPSPSRATPTTDGGAFVRAALNRAIQRIKFYARDEAEGERLAGFIRALDTAAIAAQVARASTIEPAGETVRGRVHEIRGTADGYEVRVRVKKPDGEPIPAALVQCVRHDGNEVEVRPLSAEGI